MHRVRIDRLGGTRHHPRRWATERTPSMLRCSALPCKPCVQVQALSSGFGATSKLNLGFLVATWHIVPDFVDRRPPPTHCPCIHASVVFYLIVSMGDEVFIGWWLFVFLMIITVAFLKTFQASF
jgi:hypothetical protein